MKRENGLESANGHSAHGGSSSGPEAKRRKSRKSVDKQYACDEPGCNKKFTRLEHLTRHQLNHKPKEIYRCTYPGCDKTFVRQDLRVRHLDRHRNRLNGGRRLRRLTNFQDSIDEYGHGVIGLGGAGVEPTGASNGVDVGGAGENGAGSGVAGEMALFFDGSGPPRDGGLSTGATPFGGPSPSLQGYGHLGLGASPGGSGPFKNPAYSGVAASSPMSQLHSSLLESGAPGGHGSPDQYIDMPLSDMRTPITVASNTSASVTGPPTTVATTTNPPSSRTGDDTMIMTHKARG
jgi:hypothetical protein